MPIHGQPDFGGKRGGGLDSTWIRQNFSFDKILRVDVGALGIFD